MGGGWRGSPPPFFLVDYILINFAALSSYISYCKTLHIEVYKKLRPKESLTLRGAKIVISQNHIFVSRLKTFLMAMFPHRNIVLNRDR